MPTAPVPISIASATPLLRLDVAYTRLAGCRFGPYQLSVQGGERIAILGPSGAGKSTLLKMLSGELALSGGNIWLDEKPLAGYSLPALSQRRAVLPQGSEVAFGLRSDLVVGLGRVAREHDPALARIVREAAQMACAEHLLARHFDTLSGGEKARVQLARIFAQLWDIQAGLLLVDEPLAALDPGLQYELLDSIDHFAVQRGHAVIAVLHDINHALLGFDRLWLIKDAQLHADIASNEAAVPELAALYGVTLDCARNADGELLVSVRGRQPRRKLAA